MLGQRPLWVRERHQHFFFLFEERTSCTNSQKLEVRVQLNPGLHNAPSHDLHCSAEIATAAASELFFASPRCSSRRWKGRKSPCERTSRVLLAIVLVLHLAFGMGEGDGGVCGPQASACLPRMPGFAAGPRRCQCSSCSVQSSDLSFQGRLTAFLVNYFSRGVGVEVTLHSTEDETGPVGYVLQHVPLRVPRLLVPQMSCESPGFPQEMSRDSAENDAFQ